MGVFKPWAATSAELEQGWLVFLCAAMWAMLPCLLAAAAFVLPDNKSIRSSMWGNLWLLGSFWGIGAVASLAMPDFEGNLGLMFWPLIHLCVFIIVYAIAYYLGADEPDACR